MLPTKCIQVCREKQGTRQDDSHHTLRKTMFSMEPVDENNGINIIKSNNIRG